VELAAAFDAAKSGGVIVAAIAAVFTIGYVANMLGEDEDWLSERPSCRSTCSRKTVAFASTASARTA
jgi:hypothetical protein